MNRVPLRPLFAAALVLAAAHGCSSSDSVVVVTVEAPAAVHATTVRLTLTNAGAADTRTFPEKPDSMAALIAWPATLAVILPRARTGTLDVAADALDGTGTILAHGSAHVTITKGGRSAVTLRLVPGAFSCGGGPSGQCAHDGGAEGGPTVDLGGPGADRSPGVIPTFDGDALIGVTADAGEAPLPKAPQDAAPPDAAADTSTPVFDLLGDRSDGTAGQDMVGDAVDAPFVSPGGPDSADSSVPDLAASCAGVNVRSRFVLILDTSVSMLETLGSNDTYGDGSLGYEGCNIDGNTVGWPYDDSRLYQAKQAITATLFSLTNAEFALARFRGIDLGQACAVSADCPKDPLAGGNVYSGVYCVGLDDMPCTGRPNCRCLHKALSYKCEGNCPAACNAATRDFISYRGTACPAVSSPCQWPQCKAGEVLVPFPAAGSNTAQIVAWVNGAEGPGDPEIRADGRTPLGSSIDSVREWLANSTATDVGPSAGPLGTDPDRACRGYDIILLTDGVESCAGAPAQAAARVQQTCTNGGVWDAADLRCEIAGQPAGTRSIRVYVIGFGVGTSIQASLHMIAAAGGTSTAYLPTTRSALVSAMADIVTRARE